MVDFLIFRKNNPRDRKKIIEIELNFSDCLAAVKAYHIHELDLYFNL